MFQLVTGDGGRLGHKLAIRTIYLIHSNRFRSKGELGPPARGSSDFVPAFEIIKKRPPIKAASYCFKLDRIVTYRPVYGLQTPSCTV